eukprot:TRINITY_DN7799_c0_g3_i1.p1 TRINITY_DN7799_c0_g3~~TRINITY_DN7799_c0_g3_i1.p1  ORF type:complete len:979 (+),score=333.92 TRINITY_DN7799_c0_g3_i1:62-2998(+)
MPAADSDACGGGRSPRWSRAAADSRQGTPRDGAGATPSEAWAADPEHCVPPWEQSLLGDLRKKQRELSEAAEAAHALQTRLHLRESALAASRREIDALRRAGSDDRRTAAQLREQLRICVAEQQELAAQAQRECALRMQAEQERDDASERLQAAAEENRRQSAALQRSHRHLAKAAEKLKHMREDRDRRRRTAAFVAESAGQGGDAVRQEMERARLAAMSDQIARLRREAAEGQRRSEAVRERLLLLVARSGAATPEPPCSLEAAADAVAKALAACPSPRRGGGDPDDPDCSGASGVGLRRANEALRTAAERSQQECTRLAARLAEAARLEASLREELGSAEGRLRAAREEARAGEGALRDAERRLTRIAGELQGERARAAGAEERARATEFAVAATAGEASSLRAERDALRAERDTLRAAKSAESDAATRASEEAKEAAAAERAAAERLRGQLDEARTELARATRREQSLSAQAEALHGRLQQQEQLVQRLQLGARTGQVSPTRSPLAAGPRSELSLTQTTHASDSGPSRRRQGRHGVPQALDRSGALRATARRYMWRWVRWVVLLREEMAELQLGRALLISGRALGEHRLCASVFHRWLQYVLLVRHCQLQYKVQEAEEARNEARQLNEELVSKALSAGSDVEKRGAAIATAAHRLADLDRGVLAIAQRLSRALALAQEQRGRTAAKLEQQKVVEAQLRKELEERLSDTELQGLRRVASQEAARADRAEAEKKKLAEQLEEQRGIALQATAESLFVKAQLEKERKMPPSPTVGLPGDPASPGAPAREPDSGATAARAAAEEALARSEQELQQLKGDYEKLKGVALSTEAELAYIRTLLPEGPPATELGGTGTSDASPQAVREQVDRAERAEQEIKVLQGDLEKQRGIALSAQTELAYTRTLVPGLVKSDQEQQTSPTNLALGDGEGDAAARDELLAAQQQALAAEERFLELLRTTRRLGARYRECQQAVVQLAPPS